MLKSIVNGAEHDIISIPMKGKNLVHANSDRTGSFLTWQKDKSTFTLNGSPSVADSLPFSTLDLKAGTYTLSIHGLKEIGAGKTGLYLSGVDTVRVQTNRTYTITEDTTVTLRLVISVSDVSYDNEEITVMFNIGSTALPYEPYGYQNGWEVRDNQDRLIWGREDELQTATGTLSFKGYALPVKVKSFLGNAVQNGTPAPDNIATPEMCGVRTGNLVDIEKKTGTQTNHYYVTCALSQSESDSFVAALNNNEGPFSASCVSSNSAFSLEVIIYYTDNTTQGLRRDTTINFTPDRTKTIQKVGLRLRSDSTDYDGTYVEMTNFMLNSGSTALPYEPYGWKVPFTCAGQTVPVYLGEAPTVRRVRKLVLTGDENFFNKNDTNPQRCLYYFTSALSHYPKAIPDRNSVCTHLPWGAYTNKSFYISETGNIFYINFGQDIMNAQPSGNTIKGLKEYLATQYAAGHPVTIWYVLANEQTGIVNEPLCKISTYADEITTIQVHGLSAPLYGIGDYKDTLNLSTGVVTRKVKKLVLTGEESVNIFSGATIAFTIRVSDMLRTERKGVCTHFAYQYSPGQSNKDGLTFGDLLYFTLSSATASQLGIVAQDTASFKSFLQLQYQNGTPVTVWYVLNTPTTETITVPTGMTGEIEGYLTQVSTPSPTNRSVPKWNGVEETGGTYAVTVYTPPEIPTTTGENTMTVDTTLAPYEVTVEGHIKYGYWGKIREDVRSGLAQTKFPVGTILYDNEDETTGRAFQVVGYDKHFDPSLTARGYNHSMTLCQLKLSGLWQFDATEAFLYTTVEMQPGTYKFKIPNYDTTYGGNKTYYFTSTASVPVDSQITLSWAYQQPPKTVTAYAGPNPQTKTTAITGFNALPLSEWIEGESPEAIDLGTIKLANNDPDSAYGKLNHIHRARYGSNNYYQSGLRQLLNTDLASNNWWHQTTIFDRPYANRTTNGYLRSLNEDFINVLATPEITHITNNIFEYPSLDGRTFALNTEYKINTDKVFLLSHTEVGLSSSPNIGTVLDYYSTHNTNNDRIKYRIDNGNAYYWWLRTPNPSNCRNVRYVDTPGALNDYNAINHYGVATACIIQ